MTHATPAWFYDLTAEQTAPDSARAVVFGVPYGHGSHRAPLALLTASPQVETFDEALACTPGDVGLATEGLADLARPLDLAGARALVAERLLAPLERGVFPVLLGGSRELVPLAVEATLERHPELGLIYLGSRPDGVLASAHLPLAALAGVGVRRASREEWVALKRHDRIACAWSTSALVSEPDWLAEVRAALAPLPRRIVLAVDASVLDPSLMPALVEAPEPGGLGWRALSLVLAEAFGTREVVAMTATGLCPIEGMHSPDFLIAKLVYRAIAMRFEREAQASMA